MNHNCRHRISPPEALCQAGTGLGMLGLVGLLRDAGLLGEATARRVRHSHAGSGKPARWPKPPHFPAKAKHVIHIYLNGGPSQVDTFDPKPLLKQLRRQDAAAGEPLHRAQDRHGAARRRSGSRSTARAASRSARSSPARPQHADDLCVIRSMQANTPNHEQSMRLMNCGDERLSRPSMGAWLTYGMGTENQNLPGYIAMCPGLPVADVSNWRSAFLPGIYQGTYIDTRKEKAEDLIENIRNPVVSQARPAPAARPAGRAEPSPPAAAGRGRQPRGPDRQLRAGLPDADGGDRRLRRRAGAAVHPRRCTAPACRPGSS